ncbi:hypothetical protein DFH11DRAFT_604567 [Phellopilus nigrolimitatus]|nr:hypothetical protein DFH11DRAFT_604567 [Phellopilus nigrolimitatus]
MFSIRSNIEPIDPSQIPAYVLINYAEIYCQIAIVACLTYNIITTMDTEVKYFWTNPRAFTSLLYFTNRYVGLFSAFLGCWCESFVLCGNFRYIESSWN